MKVITPVKYVSPYMHFFQVCRAGEGGRHTEAKDSSIG